MVLVLERGWEKGRRRRSAQAQHDLDRASLSTNLNTPQEVLELLSDVIQIREKVVPKHILTKVGEVRWMVG